MAMTAVLTLTKSTVLVNQLDIATVTVSNSSMSTAYSVLTIQPIVTVTATGQRMDAAGVGVPDLGPGVTVSVPALGSLTFPFGLCFFSPSTGLLGAGSGTYTVGAQCSASDGTNFAATPATVTVNNPAFPASQQ